MSKINKYKELTILVVDDNAQNIQLVHSILQKNGYEKVFFATSGVQAIEVANKIQPDLILLDIMMPLMDGYEVLETLKGNPLTNNISVIFLTAKSNNEDVTEGLRMGAVDYISKPFDNEILLTRVQTHLLLRYKTLQLEDEKQLLEHKLKMQLKSRLKSDTKLYALYQQSHFGISFLDKNGNFTDVNNEFSEMLGYTRDELLKLNADQLTHPDDKQINQEYLKYITSNKIKILEFKKRCIKKDGSVRWFSINMTRVEELFEDFYLASVSEDITDRIAMEEELEIKEEMLITQSRQAAMGNMVGLIAHQWKQPLNMIGMIANNIKLDLELGSPIDTLELNKDMDQLHEQISYLSDTIEDFKNYFKPNKEQQLIKADEIMEKALTLIDKSFINHKITIEKDYQIRTALEVFPNELMQVFINILNNAKDVLISNCIKDPKVVINMYEDDINCTITIADNAGGIPEDAMDKIGELYFSTKGDDGTGLGMYMSKNIVEKHLDGKLQWENKDEGALFSISIPIK